MLLQTGQLKRSVLERRGLGSSYSTEVHDRSCGALERRRDLPW